MILEEADDGQLFKTSKMNLGYLPQEPNQQPKETILEECMDGAFKLKKLKQDLDLI